MSKKYYIQVFIERAGTAYVKADSKTKKSFAGHMWFKIYEFDGYGKELYSAKAG